MTTSKLLFKRPVCTIRYKRYKSYVSEIFVQPFKFLLRIVTKELKRVFNILPPAKIISFSIAKSIIPIR